MLHLTTLKYKFQNAPPLININISEREATNTEYAGDWTQFKSNRVSVSQGDATHHRTTRCKRCVLFNAPHWFWRWPCSCTAGRAPCAHLTSPSSDSLPPVPGSHLHPGSSSALRERRIEIFRAGRGWHFKKEDTLKTFMLQPLIFNVSFTTSYLKKKMNIYKKRVNSKDKLLKVKNYAFKMPMLSYLCSPLR